VQIVVSILRHSAFAYRAARKKRPPVAHRGQRNLEGNRGTLVQRDPHSAGAGYSAASGGESQRRDSVAERREFELPVQIREQDSINCTYNPNKSARYAQTELIFKTRGLTMSATVKSATVKSATVEFATVEFAAVESVAVETIMESAEAFAEKSTISAIAVAVRGIAVASVIPPSVETSRQTEGRNQKRPIDDQLYFHYLMRRQAGE